MYGWGGGGEDRESKGVSAGALILVHADKQNTERSIRIHLTIRDLQLNSYVQIKSYSTHVCFEKNHAQNQTELFNNP